MVDFNKLLQEEREKQNMAKKNKGDNPFGNPDEGSGSGEDDDNFVIDALPTEEEENAKWVIPDADYPGTLIGLEHGESKSSGNPQWILEWKLDGPKEFRGRTFKDWLTLTPAALWKVREAIEAMNIPREGKGLKFKKKDAIGKRCTLRIEAEEYDGKTRSKIVKYKPIGKDAPPSASGAAKGDDIPA